MNWITIIRKIFKFLKDEAGKKSQNTLKINITLIIIIAVILLAIATYLAIIIGVHIKCAGSQWDFPGVNGK